MSRLFSPPLLVGMSRCPIVIAVLVGTVCGAQALSSQMRASDQEARNHGRGIGVWTGLGIATPNLSPMHEREMFMLGIQYRQPIGKAEFVTLSYAPSVLPAVVLARPAPPPPGKVAGCVVCPAATAVPAFSAPDRSFGVGLIPAEIELIFGPDTPLQVVWSGGVGLLWLDSDADTFGARRFNLLGTGRFGLRVHLPLGIVDLGARVQRLSHARIGKDPAVNVLVWSLGWSTH